MHQKTYGARAQATPGHAGEAQAPPPPDLLAAVTVSGGSRILKRGQKNYLVGEAGGADFLGEGAGEGRILRGCTIGRAATAHGRKPLWGRCGRGSPPPA